MIGNKFCYFFTLLTFFFFTHAIELSLQVTDLENVSLKQVKQGEPFLIEVSVYDDQKGLGEPVLTHMNKLSVCQRYPVSTHITIINGQQQIQRKHVYKARIDTLGPFALGPAYFDLGGQVIRSSAVSFMVVKGEAHEPTAVVDPFIYVKVNKESAYVGEQVLLNVRLCYKKPVDSLVLEPWRMSSSKITQLGPPVQETFSYDGHSWSCFLYTFAVYPQQNGDLVIPGLQAHGEREKESARGSFMSHFFFGFDREKIQMQSKPRVITIKPLPESARAVDAVGEFISFSAILDKKELEPGTAATLSITLVGNGDMQHISLNNLALPSAIKSYESKTSLELDQQHPGFLIRRQELVLQALEAGAFTIASHVFTFFNPVTQTVSQLKTFPLTLTVKKGIAPKEPQERMVLAVQQKHSWPTIPHYLMVIGAVGLVFILLIMYLVMCYQAVIEKKITYYRFKRQVKKAHKTGNAQLLYQAWFTLLSGRLGVKKMVRSLYEIEHFFEQDVRLKWRYYVAELEKTAFQSRETIFDINDLIMQTYDWLDKIKDLL